MPAIWCLFSIALLLVAVSPRAMALLRGGWGPEAAAPAR